MTTSTTFKKYFVCNFKSLLLKDDFITLKENLSSLSKSNNIELILCPPTTYLYIFDNIDYKLGSQEISMYENGAYTGENSAEQLKSLNVSYTLIGHHESRCILKEDENSLLNKLVNASKYGIVPIYFIGETLLDKQSNQVQESLTKELELITKLPLETIQKMLIVYEPVWSIGSGETPTLEDLTNNIKLINNFIYNNYNITIPIIYGGSINENNINEIATLDILSGIILGESSTNFNILSNIYNIYKKTIESTK